MNALNSPEIKNSEIVLVHDAVRPFASSELVSNIIKAVKKYNAAIPATMPKETIKQKDNNDCVRLTYARSLLASVQTPQGFNKNILIDAYKKAKKDNFYGTDDASLVEHSGNKVKIIQGEETNIKITTPLDLEIAYLILKNKKT
jgi:2-C-methyl-D-erythritol 4-phosphate cytidylyltransferase